MSALPPPPPPSGVGPFSLRSGEQVLFGPVKSDVKYWAVAQMFPQRREQALGALDSARTPFAPRRMDPFAVGLSMRATGPATMGMRPQYMSRYLWTNYRVVVLAWNRDVVEQELPWGEVLSIQLQTLAPLPSSDPMRGNSGSYRSQMGASLDTVGDVVFVSHGSTPLVFGMIQYAATVFNQAQVAFQAYSAVHVQPQPTVTSPTLPPPPAPTGRETGLVLELQPLFSMSRDPVAGWIMMCPACRGSTATPCVTCRGLGRFQPSPLAQRAATDHSLMRAFYGDYLNQAAEVDAQRRTHFAADGSCMDCRGTGRLVCMQCQGRSRVLVSASPDGMGRLVMAGNEPLREVKGRLLVDQDGFMSEWCACGGSLNRQCTWCGGTGKGAMLGCSKCGGSGFFPCKACAGQGALRVVIFHGEKWVRASTGKAWLCEECYGEGTEEARRLAVWGAVENRRCRACGGSGVGTREYGRVNPIDPQDPWGRTRGCPACGGTGNELCQRCTRVPPPPLPPQSLLGCAYLGSAWVFIWT